mmetsp:Transcript_59566/g.171995  ORF Transcript_59566/g.171995 Transcript_59566/m.171995 type:complete len:301 (+) Transcript_59566:293-1195(+)
MLPKADTATCFTESARSFCATSVRAMAHRMPKCSSVMQEAARPTRTAEARRMSRKACCKPGRNDSAATRAALLLRRVTARIASPCKASMLSRFAWPAPVCTISNIAAKLGDGGSDARPCTAAASVSVKAAGSGISFEANLAKCSMAALAGHEEAPGAPRTMRRKVATTSEATALPMVAAAKSDMASIAVSLTLHASSREANSAKVDTTAKATLPAASEPSSASCSASLPKAVIDEMRMSSSSWRTPTSISARAAKRCPSLHQAANASKAAEPVGAARNSRPPVLQKVARPEETSVVSCHA